LSPPWPSPVNPIPGTAATRVPQKRCRFAHFPNHTSQAPYAATTTKNTQPIAVSGIQSRSHDGIPARRAGAVFNELKTRGLADILIAVVDGLKGLAEAIGTVYPKTTVQTCIVHLLRNSLDYASYKDRKALAQALRPIYTAPSAEAAGELLEAFAAGPWGEKYPSIAASWRRSWEHVVPFFVFPPDIRRVIYTTNAIESLNMQLRKIIKTRGHFPTDEAAVKLIWLAIRNVLAKVIRTTYDWKSAMNQFAVLFGDRFTLPRA
jgi:transposase-like protein